MIVLVSLCYARLHGVLPLIEEAPLIMYSSPQSFLPFPLLPRSSYAPSTLLIPNSWFRIQECA